jgi:hypothetical protein
LEVLVIPEEILNQPSLRVGSISKSLKREAIFSESLSIKGKAMDFKQALQLAVNFLTPFKEAGNIYDDYIDDEGITDDEYEEMLNVLGRFLSDRDHES